MRKDNSRIGHLVFLILKIDEVMFFYLTDSLIVASSEADYIQICNAVRNLANAACESKHLLLGDYNVLKYFADIYRNVGDSVALILNNLVHNYATSTIPNGLTFYVEVVRDNQKNCREENGIAIQQLCFTEFIDSSTTQKMQLVGEDLNDCKMFIRILNWYKKKHGIQLNCSYEFFHGAGNRTSENLYKLKRDNKIALCIVDTDIRYPRQPVSSHATHKKCMRIGNTPLVRTIVLGVHEIENIIPVDYINLLRFDSGEALKKECYDRLYNHAEAENLLPYFDHKKGVVKMTESMSDPNFICFAEQCFNVYPEWQSNHDFQTFYDSLPEKGIIYPGLGENLFKNVLEQTELETIVGFKAFQLNEWQRIGLEILNFGCARSLESIS